MSKKDYFDDPNAPAANSLVVAVAVVVRDDEGRLLMIQRSDNGLWALPGGAQDIGESTREAAIREVGEETGIAVEVTGISGIYSDPRHVIAYGNGEVRQEFSIVLRARPIGGMPVTSEESTQVAWVAPAEIPELRVDRAMRLRIEHGLADRSEPFLT